MRAFFKGKKRSAGYARDRMQLLLISERIDCSPQMMKMLKNDLIHTVKKVSYNRGRTGQHTDHTGTACPACSDTCSRKKEQIDD